ncbi:hypothetical protein BpHYR1_012397 [Brachionus plicatilis]|uniref:Uncharacterized protein n=1 Tax=Brachionus plicatilis TaxID=10195 RepID=A0A3M7Q631_BRAPC|nr:hypothetical protein BpHYR1_012397 [Brachionus plicatilis]
MAVSASGSGQLDLSSSNISAVSLGLEHQRILNFGKCIVKRLSFELLMINSKNTDNFEIKKFKLTLKNIITKEKSKNFLFRSKTDTNFVSSKLSNLSLIKKKQINPKFTFFKNLFTSLRFHHNLIEL